MHTFALFSLLMLGLLCAYKLFVTVLHNYTFSHQTCFLSRNERSHVEIKIKVSVLFIKNWSDGNIYNLEKNYTTLKKKEKKKRILLRFFKNHNSIRLMRIILQLLQFLESGACHVFWKIIPAYLVCVSFELKYVRLQTDHVRHQRICWKSVVITVSSCWETLCINSEIYIVHV